MYQVWMGHAQWKGKKIRGNLKIFTSPQGGREFFSKNGNQIANVIKVQPRGISVPSLDALRAMEGQKNRGNLKFFTSPQGGEKFFFEKWGPKYKRHKGITIRNKCTKFGWATCNGRAKKIQGILKIFISTQGGGKFFLKNGDQNTNVIKVYP